MKYEVKLLKSEEGYAVWCPALPGCWSQGDTEAEALENIKDAVREYLADADADPDPIALAETRTIEVA